MKKYFSGLKPLLIFLLSIILLVTLGMPVWADKYLTASSPQSISEVVDSTGRDTVADFDITQDENQKENQYIDEQQELMKTLNQESLQIDQLDNSFNMPHPILEDAIPFQQEVFQSITEEDAVVTASTGNELIKELKKESTQKRNSRIFQQDRFNYQQKDVEELLLDGYTLEDIYLSDQLGNEWLVNPKELIQQKRDQKESWATIEIELRMKVEKEIEALQVKHKLKAGKVSQVTENLAERLELLQQMEMNSKAVTEDVIEAYRTNGQSGLQRLEQQHERRDWNE